MATPAAQPSQSSEDWQTTKETVRDRTAFLFNNSLLSDIKFVVADAQDKSDNDSKDESNNDSKQESINESKQESESDLKQESDESKQESHTDSKKESGDSDSKDEPDSDSRDVSDSRPVRVPAHKFVLAISSPVFEAMFYGQMAEKGEEVELPDTDSHSLLEFLRFVYSDEVNLTSDNVFAVLYLADKYIVPCLAAKCWSFIDKNTSACVKSDKAVSTLSHVTLVSLLKRDSLRIKELPLFDAVKHWAEAKCEEKGLEPTGEAMREILGEAVNFIRFPTMSQQDFAKKVVPIGILTGDDAVEVHQYFFRVMPTSNIKFPCTYRAGIASSPLLHQCSLHKYIRKDDSSIVGSPYMLVEGKEDLQFVVEPKNIHLKGVRLFTGKIGKHGFSAVVRILDENGGKVGVKEGTFAGEVIAHNQFGCDIIRGFDVMFEVPILIWRSAKYRIEVHIQTLHGTRACQITTDPLAVVEEAGVHFIFKGSSRHIYQLLFHTLN